MDAVIVEAAGVGSRGCRPGGCMCRVIQDARIADAGAEDPGVEAKLKDAGAEDPGVEAAEGAGAELSRVEA
ncbi:MAG: hypothetical protein ACOX34_03245 [Bacillota bacterium]|jgi:hypothetical protein